MAGSSSRGPERDSNDGNRQTQHCQIKASQKRPCCRALQKTSKPRLTMAQRMCALDACGHTGLVSLAELPVSTGIKEDLHSPDDGWLKNTTVRTTPVDSQTEVQGQPPLAPSVAVYANLPIEWPLARISVCRMSVSSCGLRSIEGWRNSASEESTSDTCPGRWSSAPRKTLTLSVAPWLPS